MVRRGEDADASGEGTSWIVLRHAQAEGLGLLTNVLRDFGVHHRYLDPPRGDALPRDLRGIGGLIVLGGPMAAYETDRHPYLAAETALIERSISAGRPVLGICLGAQLIAQALGARVYKGERREVGWGPIRLTDDGKDDPTFVGANVGETLDVFHMHGDTYELPPDASNLASTALYEQQAFSFGELVYGFQFHLEFTEAIIQRLCTEPESQKYIVEAGVDPKQLMADSAQHVQDVTDIGHELFSGFFRQCGL